MKGYGRLIEQARIAEGLTPEQLGRKLGRSKGIVYRLEAEEQEPNAEQVNRLVAALPISAERLLVAMGVHLTLPEAAKLPPRLLSALLSLNGDDLAAIQRLAERAAAHPPEEHSR